MRTAVALGTLVHAAPLLAQSIVIPLPASTRIGEGDGASMFNARPCRTQYLYAARELGVPLLTIASLAFRRSANFAQPNFPATATLSVMLSVSPVLATAPSTSFAANHGGNASTVFAGQFNLPARPLVLWPAPWEAPLLLSAPFLYVATLGKTLVIDVACSALTPAATWITEEYNVAPGSIASRCGSPTA